MRAKKPAKRPPRRCTKFTASKRDRFLDALRKGKRRGDAAKAAGVSRWTVRDAIDREPDFAIEVDQAELDANELIEDALFKAAKKGNTTAIQVWLYNRWPERWRDQRNLGKQSALELFLATLPAELAESLRQTLASQGAASGPEAPRTEAGS